jgi:hypothetical protein
MAENPTGSGLVSESGAPPEPLTQAAPAPAPPTSMPPAAWGTSPPARKGRGRWVAVTLILVFALFVVGGGGAYVANASLSTTYSPQQAVLNYLAAQQQGDVNAMLAAANFTRGDGSFEQFFNKSALTAMLDLSENKAISDVKIESTSQADSNTANVKASMKWAGSTYSHEYSVHRNLADAHFLFYNSWKVDVPFTTITFTLPSQPGPLEVDGILVPSGSAGGVQAIAGYHSVSMEQSALYDRVAQTVNGLEVFPAPVLFDGKLSASATAAIAVVIKAGSLVCNASKYYDCPNHLYHAPVKAYTIYYLRMPGYAEIDYQTYIFKLSGDLTKGMKVTVAKEDGVLYAEGTCASTLSVSGYGDHTYRFKGTWGANVTLTGTTFKATVYPDCADKKA